MVPTSKSKKKKTSKKSEVFEEVVDIDVSNIIRVTQPTLYFQVQKAIQDQAVVLVDLYSNKPISGQVNLASIGLIQKTSLPTIKQKPPLGFPIKHQASLNKEAPPRFVERVEATLSAYHGEQEGDPLLIVIQVINQKHLEIWSQKIVNLIPSFLVIGPKNKPVTSVVFEVEALCLPGEDDPDSSIDAILNEIQKFRPESGDSAVSSDFVDGNSMDEDGYEDA